MIDQMIDQSVDVINHATESAMNQSAIFYPVAAMMILVAIVTGFMLKERIVEMKARRIHPNKVSSSTQMNQVLENTKAADNYKNLAEMPILFYVLCTALFTTQMVSNGWLYAAWAYAALRALHSFIHIGYNTVMHRFYAFAASLTVLFSMWAVFVWQLATGN
jgi:hypothetical protein